MQILSDPCEVSRSLLFPPFWDLFRFSFGHLDRLYNPWQDLWALTGSITIGTRAFGTPLLGSYSVEGGGFESERQAFPNERPQLRIHFFKRSLTRFGSASL